MYLFTEKILCIIMDYIGNRRGIMLSPELKKLKDKLLGISDVDIDNTKLLNELKKLDEISSSKVKSLKKSLAVSSSKCPTCGHVL